MRSLLFASVATALLATAFGHAASAAQQKAAIGEWGLDTKGLSKTVTPGDDFYRYVNDAWLKSAKIPAGLPAIDSFTEVYLSTEQRVAGIIKEAREGNDAPGTSRTADRRLPPLAFRRSASQRARHDANCEQAIDHRGNQ